MVYTDARRRDTNASKFSGITTEERQDKARQGKTRQDKARQGKASYLELSRTPGAFTIGRDIDVTVGRNKNRRRHKKMAAAAVVGREWEDMML